MKNFKTTKSCVLYISLEDPPRRIQRRLKIMLGKRKAPENLLIPADSNKFPKLNAGGLEALTMVIKKRPDIKLIIIDTFGRFTKNTSARSDYQSDVDLLSPLQELAVNTGVCILLISHTRKTPGNSVYEEILGSMGVVGTPDSLLVMKKTNGKVVLHVEGRDLMENQYEIEFQKERGRWLLKGSGNK
jgi:RecA-family ATPase